MSGKEIFEKVKNEIAPIYGSGEASSIAAIVLEDGFGIKRNNHETGFINNNQLAAVEEIISRLLKNEPVQYVLNKTIFYGLPFYVDSNVLIPRQETEELVAWILETIQNKGGDEIRVLDVGTGSGCIPIALKKKRPSFSVGALDVSSGALEVAKKNAVLNNVNIDFWELDVLDEKNWNKLPSFDIIVSNPPYIAEVEKNMIPENVLQFEPHLALFAGGNDALVFYKRITEFAKRNLNTGGWLFFETNEFNAEAAKELMVKGGFENVELKKDLNGKDRMLRGDLITNY